MNETKRKLPAILPSAALSPRRQEESAPSAVDWWLVFHQEAPSIYDESLAEVLLAFHPFARKKGGEP